MLKETLDNIAYLKAKINDNNFAYDEPFKANRILYAQLTMEIARLKHIAIEYGFSLDD